MANLENDLESRNGPCTIHILHQDGPLCAGVYEVTLTLLNLANRCWTDAQSVSFYHDKFAGKRTVDPSGRTQGSAFHERLYDLAKQAQKQGKLPSNIRITRVANRAIEESDKNRRKWWNSSKGPDFVLNGRLGSQDVIAAWDLTSAKALAEHYDRDVAGRPRSSKKSRKEHKAPFDPEIQQLTDTMYPWTSYIAICY